MLCYTILCYTILYYTILYYTTKALCPVFSTATKGAPKEGGLNMGRHEDSNMKIIESKARSIQCVTHDPHSLETP